MNVPNQLSLFRLLIVPCVVLCLVYYGPDREWMRPVALAFFVVGILTDALDGYIARKYSLKTKLGTILDPIADKALVLSVFIACASLENLPDHMKIPAWFNITVISRDVLLVVGTTVLFALRRDWAVTPNRLGKWTTATQMGLVLVLFLGLPFKIFLMWAAAGVTVLSALSYLRIAVKVTD